MKILCLIDSLGSGGAQKQIIELSKGFAEKNHDVSILLYHNNIFYNEILNYTNIKLDIIEEKNYLYRFLKIRSYILKHKFDVVLSFLEGPNLYSELSSIPFKRWKIFVGERSADPNILFSKKRKFIRLFHFFSDNIISNSEKNISIIRKINPFLRIDKCNVIYNIVDFNYWKNEELKCTKSNKIKLLVVASHIQYKNSLGLVKALKILSEQERSRISINWYGKNGNDNSLETTKDYINLNNLEGIINFYDHTIEIKKAYQDCDAVGLFSFFEGMPNVICEAMAMSKVVISSNVSDISKIFKNKPQCMFNPNNINEIANSIKWLLSLSDEDRISIGLENRKLALKLFDKNKIINQYLTIFSK